MAGNVIPEPKFHAHTDAGAPAAGYLLYSYSAGTSTPLSTYSESTLTTPNANPTVLDARGEATIFASPVSYKFVLKTAAGVTVWTVDNVVGIALGSDLTSVTTRVTALEAIPNRSGVCEGRLTLTTVTPVTTADVTAATTVYFTPYKGNRIGLYDGSSAWVVRSFTELSIALGTDAANLPYDVFAYDNSGTVAIERLVWTNTTTRATALVLQNGVLVKSGATTRRYLGTYLTTATIGQTEDSDLKRYVWNYYNRIPKRLRVADATASWVYTTATYRQANAATGNQVAIVNGYLEELLALEAYHSFANSTADVEASTSIGEDSTSAGTATTMSQSATSTVVNIKQQVRATLIKAPAVGYHYYAWLEKSAATGACTWYGTSSFHVGGLLGTWRC